MPPRTLRRNLSLAMFMTKAGQRGFTLLELIFFIVVVSAGLAGILSVMNSAVGMSAEPMVRKQVMVLAESILEEIVQKEYADTDPYGLPGNETTRITMDDVSDYHGKTEAIFTDWPAILSDYKVEITVSAASLGVNDMVPAKKVTVTVTGKGYAVSLSGYRGDY
ncbi:MAG: MSHA pilin protein MshD [Candidatus Azotimanducaceae bacterium]|jgi:MSHA pilin protein MshD